MTTAAFDLADHPRGAGGRFSPKGVPARHAPDTLRGTVAPAPSARRVGECPDGRLLCDEHGGSSLPVPAGARAEPDVCAACLAAANAACDWGREERFEEWYAEPDPDTVLCVRLDAGGRWQWTADRGVRGQPVVSAEGTAATETDAKAAAACARWGPPRTSDGRRR